MSTTTPSATMSQRTTKGLPGPLLVGGAFALTTLTTICFELGNIVFTDQDPYRSEGPIDTIVGVGLFGGVAFLIALALAIPLSRDPDRARVGAVVLGALAIVSLPIFWSGAPASFGAAAAWLGGLARGSHPQAGVARGFAVVGLVIAILEIVVTFVGPIAASLSGTT